MSQCTCTKDAQITCIVHPTESSLKERIAELEAEIERLRNALESIDESTHDVHAARKARKALLGGGE